MKHKKKTNSRIKTFTLYGFRNRRIRIRPDLVAAFAAGHPAPVVGPSAAAAGLEAVVAAAASPSELARKAALPAGCGVGVIGATVETLAGTRQGQWGNLGMGLRMVSEEEETEWLLKISAEINSLLRLSLAMAVSGARTLSAVRAEEDGSGQLVFKVVGASNAARTAAALTRKGEEA